MVQTVSLEPLHLCLCLWLGVDLRHAPHLLILSSSGLTEFITTQKSNVFHNDCQNWLSLGCHSRHAAAHHSTQETRMTGPGRHLHSWSGPRSMVNGVEWGSCGSLKRKLRYSYLKKGEFMLKGQNQQVLIIVFKWTFT